MSRVTLFSLLLALLLALGIRLWSMQQVDACMPYLSGNLKAQKSEWVLSGSHEIEVSCQDWIDRQPFRVQLLCMVDVAVTVAFVLNALSDLQESLAARRRMRGIS